MYVSDVNVEVAYFSESTQEAVKLFKNASSTILAERVAVAIIRVGIND